MAMDARSGWPMAEETETGPSDTACAHQLLHASTDATAHDLKR
jgi:hypothetical protein